MKTMTCSDLGGACDVEFHAETFDEMAKLSQNHGKEMFKKNDLAHLKAMGKMKELMTDPEAMSKWMDAKRKIFDELPIDTK